MQPNTQCFIVEFDEFTRQACFEILSEESFSFITVIDKKGNKKEYPAWATNIECAQKIRKQGIEQSKNMDFKIVLARQNGTLRFAKAGEWILSTKVKQSIARTVSREISKFTERKLVRGRVGTIPVS